MSSMHSSVVVLAVLTSLSVAACAGKLKVGEEDPAPGAAGENGGGAEATGARTSTGGLDSGGHSSSSGGSSGAPGRQPINGGSAAVGGSKFGENKPDDFIASGGSWVDEFPPTAPEPKSSEGCPNGPLLPDSACETEGLLCRYELDTNNHQECACTRIVGGKHRWQCWNPTVPQAACPEEAPEHGTDCFGYFGLLCEYSRRPLISCQCSVSGEQGVWDCPEILPPDVDPPEVVPERSVAEMSEAERENWCEWHSVLVRGGAGFPPITSEEVDANGYVMNSGCSYSGEFCRGSLPHVSKAHCLGNLRVSECGAPISLLTECVAGIYGATCGPFDYACLDYFETPNCDGTIAINQAQPTGPFPTCPLRVE